MFRTIHLTSPLTPENNNRGNEKYVVKHKSAKLLMTYAVRKLEAAL